MAALHRPQDGGSIFYDFSCSECLNYLHVIENFSSFLSIAILENVISVVEADL